MPTEWLETRRRAAIFGTVAEEGTGRPLPGAVVEVVRAPAVHRRLAAARAVADPQTDTGATRFDRVVAGAGGRFVFLDLPRGRFTLAATWPPGGARLGEGRTEVAVASGRSARNVPLVQIEIPTTVVGGRITADSDTPVPAAVVRAEGTGEEAYASSDGRYELRGLEPGLHTVSVRAGARLASSRVSVAPPGHASSADFVLETA